MLLKHVALYVCLGTYYQTFWYIAHELTWNPWTYQTHTHTNEIGVFAFELSIQNNTNEWSTQHVCTTLICFNTETIYWIYRFDYLIGMYKTCSSNTNFWNRPFTNSIHLCKRFLTYTDVIFYNTYTDWVTFCFVLIDYRMSFTTCHRNLICYVLFLYCIHSRIRYLSF